MYKKDVIMSSFNKIFFGENFPIVQLALGIFMLAWVFFLGDMITG